MKVYSYKKRWKWYLFIAAIAIITASLWYTNVLVRSIANEERKKIKIWAAAIHRKANLVNLTDDFFEYIKSEERKRVELWADAIHQKAQLMNYTDELFTKLRDEERKKVELWAKASKKAITAGFDEEISFYSDIISGNTTIPVILTDKHDSVISALNVNFNPDTVDILSNYLKKEFSIYKPIVYNDYGTTNLLYYKDSKIFTELKSVFGNLIQSFISEVVVSSASVPVIITESDKITPIATGNLDSNLINDEKYIGITIDEMVTQNRPIEIDIAGQGKSYIYYKDSRIFTDLKKILSDHINSFINEVVNSATVPVIITDSSRTKIIRSKNIDTLQTLSPENIEHLISDMEAQNTPEMVKISNQGNCYIYYRDSYLLTQLRYYPYVQFSIIGLFLFVAYILFNISRKSEQNQVWVGMAKETAHQLGTPLSSMMAWIEILKMRNADKNTVEELAKDVNRLSVITERFSKIGSTPKLESNNIEIVIANSIDYVKLRTSKKVNYIVNNPTNEIFVPLNIHLFEWVIENLCKNAVDAMNGVGKIEITICEDQKNAYIDIADTGKGLPKSKHKTIFNPGYTSKKRGWGLGLSLAERIIENYHSGKIFVKSSAVNKGTSFRIVLKKDDRNE